MPRGMSKRVFRSRLGMLSMRFFLFSLHIVRKAKLQLMQRREVFILETVFAGVPVELRNESTR